jgi:prolyl oligopeptidase family protein
MPWTLRARLGLSVLIAAAGAIPASAADTRRVPRPYTIEQFMDTTTVRDASFSPDEGRLLFSSNVTGVFNVYSVPVAGGPPTALTSSTSDSTYAVSFFRGDERILFTRDQGGNELNHLYKEIGDPVKDKEMLLAVSPLFHAEEVERPLMVLQGANDPRVIKAESDDIVAAVKKRGVPVEYVVFADEGHGFTKKKNQIEGYRAILKFLDTHLKAAPAALRKAS